MAKLFTHACFRDCKRFLQLRWQVVVRSLVPFLLVETVI